MKRIRIGKDIEIHWPILTNGEPASLEGRDLHILLHLPSCMESPVDFVSEGNIAIFTIPGNSQKQLGIYQLTMWENKGKSGQTVVDYCNAFELVPTTCMEGGNDSNLTTETVVLDTSELIVGLPGASAYDLYKKYNPDSELTEEKYAEAPIDAANAANEAAKAANEAIGKVGDIDKAIAGKVDKEEGKGLSTNDYTNQEKEKLAGLSNYDDTEIRKALSSKASKQDVADSEKNTLESAKSYTDTKTSELDTSLNSALGEVTAELVANISAGDAQTLNAAQEYTDQAISEIPTPDVNALIEQHNSSPTAHPDIREILNTCVGLPEFNDKTYELTFTTKAGSKIIIDLPIEQMGLEYNQTTKAIEFVNADGSISSIPVADFVKVYVGSIGSEIQIAVVGSEIRATLLNNTVSWDKLTLALQELIQGKADSSDIPLKLSELQNDSGFVTSQTLDSRLKPIEAVQKKETVIDATTLDQDKYYPVTMHIMENARATISVIGILGDSGTPSWATHGTNSFSCRVLWSVAGSGWGSYNEDRVIDDYQYLWTKDDIAPIGTIWQMGRSSNEYIYVRGGGKYHFYCSGLDSEPVLHTEEFTASGETIGAGISEVRKEESLNKVANDAVKRILMNATMGAESANWPLSLTTPLVSMQQYYTLFTSYPGQCRWALRVTDAQNAFIEEAELEPVAVSAGIELQFTSKFSKKRYAIVLTLSGGTVTAANTEYRYRDDQQKYIDATAAYNPNNKVVFNVDTGYWELNTLTDITDSQMSDIYEHGNFSGAPLYSLERACPSTKIRTTIPGSSFSVFGNVSGLFGAFGYCSNLEVIRLSDSALTTNSMGYFGAYSPKLTAVLDEIIDKRTSLGSLGIISDVPKLTTFKLRSLCSNINLIAPMWSKESALFTIENANPVYGAITITLAADAYTRLMADADIQSALQAHPNIALASA